MDEQSLIAKTIALKGLTDYQAGAVVSKEILK